MATTRAASVTATDEVNTDVRDLDARLAMPLAEAMSTQRAVRRLLPDPVDDEVVLRCIELATKRADREQPAGLGVRRGARPRGEAPARPAQPSGLGGVPAARRRRRPPRPIDAADHRRGPVASRPLRGGPGRGGALPPRPLPRARPTDRRGVVLRLGVPGGAEPAPGGPGRRAGRHPHHAPDLVGGPRPPHAGSPPHRHAGCRRSARLAEGAIRSHHPAAGGRSGAPRPLWEPTVPATGYTEPRPRCGIMEGFTHGAASAPTRISRSKAGDSAEKRTGSPVPRGAGAEAGLRRRPVQRERSAPSPTPISTRISTTRTTTTSAGSTSGTTRTTRSTTTRSATTTPTAASRSSSPGPTGRSGRAVRRGRGSSGRGRGRSARSPRGRPRP